LWFICVCWNLMKSPYSVGTHRTLTWNQQISTFLSKDRLVIRFIGFHMSAFRWFKIGICPKLGCSIPLTGWTYGRYTIRSGQPLFFNQILFRWSNPTFRWNYDRAAFHVSFRHASPTNLFFESDWNSVFVRTSHVSGIFRIRMTTFFTNTGWWLTYPSQKYESQMGWFFPTEWNHKSHVPNHQAV